MRAQIESARPQYEDDFFTAPPPPQREGEPFAGLGPGPDGESETSGPRRAIRLGVNFLWILGAIVITALQMCRGGA